MSSSNQPNGQPFPFKNAVVSVSLNLNLPEERVKKVVEENCFLAPDHPGYYEAAMRSVEEYCRDNFADLLEFLGDDPDFEAMA